MFKDMDYSDLEEAGFNTINEYVYALKGNIQNREPPTLDIIMSINNYFALFILYNDIIVKIIKNIKKERIYDFSKRYHVFFYFGYSLYLSLISIIILRFSNQIDSCYIILRSAIERCVLSQHFLINIDEYQHWKKGKQIKMSGKNGAIYKLFNQKNIEKNMEFLPDIHVDKKYCKQINSMYKTFSEVVHNIYSEMDLYISIWKESTDYSETINKINSYYTESALKFSVLLPLIIDLFMLIITYNAYILTNGQLFKMNLHTSKISELLNAFPNTKITFKKLRL